MADMEGFDRIEQRFTSLSRDAIPRAVEAVQETALDIEASAKRNAPVRTGNLRRSITHRVTVDGATVEGVVGSDLDYSLWVETGTSRMAPQPYLGPALREHEDAFRERLRRAVS